MKKIKINVGNNNKINNSNFGIYDNKKVENKNLFEKHPIIFSIVISFLVGFILLFSFWERIINKIENFL
ncbi:hypothetical protein [Ilyobacter polytropus]|uniref:Uncharacterized protein n=1 Tax=Ilyobacter polytropus (strain ATCC 51220 / DSM 2926 / LMG 16218 / CuHBu1) TaxID=572544 RepID=E3H7D5_ILYPC|nr:hypothetical protein [Ilyobacter polytropus]ADO82831.1 conserved hypothetical protein [Ilyobacter polytropus DSM 2926]